MTRSRPRKSPAEIVAPERDTPGISETHCTIPTTIASVRLSRFSERSWRAARSAAHITALQPIRAIATTHRLRRSFLMTLRRTSPTMPTGMVPRMTYQPIRKSWWPRYSGLARPSTQVRMMWPMSRAK